MNNKVLQFAKKIKEAKRAAIFLHRNPDEDSIGSALAIKLWLEQEGKEARVFSFEKTDSQFNKLKAFGKITVASPQKFSNLQAKEFSHFIYPDVASLNMINDEFVYPSKGCNVRIDHHPGKAWADLEIVDTAASSTAEVVTEVFNGLKVEWNKDIASLLMLALIGDTLNFQTPSTTEKTFKTAGFLLSKGADLVWANRLYYSKLSARELKKFAELLKNMEVDEKRELVWFGLDKSYMAKERRPGYRGRLIDFLTNNARMLSRPERYVVISYFEPGGYRINFRSSKKEADVRKWALEFGGGGHTNASGAMIKADSLKQAVKEVLAAFDRIYG
jgi:phosphoesterase RecJ-like protein